MRKIPGNTPEPKHSSSAIYRWSKSRRMYQIEIEVRIERSDGSYGGDRALLGITTATGQRSSNHHQRHAGGRGDESIKTPNTLVKVLQKPYST
ncbi:hypothetical protein I7I48_04846 [Histoplasma ohiense]|nr:hypothetical protein I7I48_04846 [Histoplasma ohiense (nom. inval.)]